MENFISGQWYKSEIRYATAVASSCSTVVFMHKPISYLSVLFLVIIDLFNRENTRVRI